MTAETEKHKSYVIKLLAFFGEVQPYVESAIKRGFNSEDERRGGL